MAVRATKLGIWTLRVVVLVWVSTDMASAQAIRPLANEYVAVYQSSDPAGIYVYSPGLTRCPNGRLIATCDLGGTRADVLVKSDPGFCRGRIFVSDDRGQTWHARGGFHFMHARPFVAGDALYILGHAGDLRVIRSDDWGETWSAHATLTQNQRWHQAPSNVWYARDHVYLVMERNVYSDVKSWSVSVLAPVLMRAPVGADLTQRENWTFAEELVFRDAVPMDQPNQFGVPFFEFDPQGDVWTAAGRNMAPPGWLETNVVQVTDPQHYWYDPAGRTLHLLMRAHTGGTGYAALAKVVENEDGSMTTLLEKNPSGRDVAFLPLPGGQMKFHILYDEPTQLYWLLSSQATDSMTRSELLPPSRFNLPNNERHRLQLHFSKNLVDWCFAGLVAKTEDPRQARHYASMVIDGDDLHILSRSGTELAHNAHNGDVLSFHTVKNFRSLVY